MAGQEQAGPGAPAGVTVRPAPSAEEAAAIAAAVEVAWPRAAAVEEPPVVRWRWSGRWWSKPVPLRRRRPW